MCQPAEWVLFQYRLDFSPEEDQTRVKKKILAPGAGTGPGKLGAFIFDGASMCTSQRLSVDRNNQMQLATVHQGNPMLITIKQMDEVAPGEVR
jgi:hypothetical protein